MGSIDTYPPVGRLTPSAVLGYYSAYGSPLLSFVSGEVDIGVSVPVDVPSGRTLKITGYAPFVNTSGAAGWVYVEIYEGATGYTYDQKAMAIGSEVTLAPVHIISPTAGAHTYKLRVGASGTGTISGTANWPVYILVEDITGGVSGPTVQPTVSRSTNITIANTETSILSMPVPANSLRVGSTFCLKVFGLFTNTTSASTSVLRVRFGTTTLTGNIAAGISMANGVTARTNIPFFFEAMVTVLSTGASGTVFGAVVPYVGNVVQQILSAPVTAAVTLDTTAAKLIEMTFISGAATTSINVLSATIMQEY